jgi:hypothetical protein
MNPQNRVHGRIRILFRNIVVVFMRQRRHCGQTKQERREGVPQFEHGRPVRRRHRATVSSVYGGRKPAPIIGFEI